MAMCEDGPASSGSISTDAFNQRVAPHLALAYNVAYRLMGEADGAADAVQDSLLKAYRALHQYHGGSFRAWLLRIVTNTCYDALRQRSRSLAFAAPLDDDDGGAGACLAGRSDLPEEYVMRRELAARIQLALEALPVDQRIVLVLSDVEGLGYAEIAQITGANMGTVKSRLSRARARLRMRLHAERTGGRGGQFPAGTAGRVSALTDKLIQPQVVGD
jgi:RNA polymerase sigma-70 factor (ECF subfamily)